MNRWQIKDEENSEEWDDLPDDVAKFNDYEMIACEWWEVTFSDRDYIQTGTIEIKSPDGVVKRFEMDIEAIPQASAREVPR